MARLEQALEVAHTFRHMIDAEMNALRRRTAESARRGELDLFKTSSLHDRTAQHTR